MSRERGVCERLVASCRICLHSHGVLNIFDSGDTLAKLRVCTPIQIEKNDGLPDSLCRKCAKLLDDAYSFWIECEQSDRCLHRSLRANTLQTKVEVKVELDGKVETRAEITQNVEISLLELLPINKAEDDTKCEVEFILKKWMGARPDLQIRRATPLSPLTQCKVESEIKESKNKNVCKKYKSKVQETNDDSGPIDLSDEICLVEDTYVYEDEISVANNLLHNPTKYQIYQCDYCTRQFTDIIEFEKHFMAHKNETYYCEICKKTFKGTKRIEIHKTVHQDLQLPCEVCGKLYHKKRLKQHVTNSHKAKEPSLQTCALCNKVLASVHQLRMHNIMRHRNKPVQCDHCGKTCTTKAGLAEHIERVHTARCLRTEAGTTWAPGRTCVRSATRSSRSAAT